MNAGNWMKRVFPVKQKDMKSDKCVQLIRAENLDETANDIGQAREQIIASTNQQSVAVKDTTERSFATLTANNPFRFSSSIQDKDRTENQTRYSADNSQLSAHSQRTNQPTSDGNIRIQSVIIQVDGPDHYDWYATKGA
ncbi:uncharacterized protein TRIADDRAFT_59320 [Trichoplax adhaerens]|uniref:Uncharacterized protein n=1 Tax=Trichoplax adhaerens TaxID=10228 RepID=B3S4R7_TRIAD|nr:predicted protein [Trichoplax adhaerens]EDV22135.1 predicted protein [Trichoplax adhaerens]|eukprot:XP_002115290.1 predicted protein [Trichoplax adhaerens]